MKIFILSILVVSFISLCFFKKRFWENRYLVLLIIGGVALIATLTTNYATRNKLNRNVETIWTVPIEMITLNDSLVDDSRFTTNKELGFSDHYTLDSTGYVTSHYFFYYDDESTLRVGYVAKNKQQYKYWKDVYIAPSENDTTAYITKLRQNYDPNPKYWTAGFSLPSVKTIKCIYLPPQEYAMIPDSLIREMPF